MDLVAFVVDINEAMADVVNEVEVETSTPKRMREDSNNSASAEVIANKKIKPITIAEDNPVFTNNQEYLRSCIGVATLARGKFSDMVVIKDCVSFYRNVFRAFRVVDKKNLVEIRKVGRAIDEIKLMTKLEHPYILNITATFQTERFLVSEVAQAGRNTVKSLIVDMDRFGLKMERSWIRIHSAQLLTALDYIHNEGYIVRNLRPGSIIVDARGNVCISDLSMAVPIAKTKGDGRKKRGYLHMAPEVGRGEAAHITSDLYSLGAVVYFMLFHRLPKQNRSGILKCAGEDLPTRMFVRKLLIEKVKERRFFKNCDRVRRDPYFRNITNWCDIISREFTDAKDYMISRKVIEKKDEDEEDGLEYVHNAAAKESGLSAQEQELFADLM